jgi:predicted TIM-barrel fold metal-dependent hydrolase
LDQLLEMMGGPGMLAYASDYPHEHGDGVSLLIDKLSEGDRRRVMYGNASALYGLDGNE